MGKPASPTPPDVNTTINATNKSNLQTALTQASLNNVNQVNPFGSLTYDKTGKGKNTKYTQTTTLSPALQSIFDRSIATQGAVGSAAQQQADGLSANLKPLTQPQYQTYGGAPTLTGTGGTIGGLVSNVNADPIQMNLGTDDYSADRQRVEDALFERLNGQISKDRTALDVNLANKGIGMESTAYRSAQDDLGRTTNDARIAAILNAGQEQNRLQSLKLNDAGFANSAQAQKFGQGSANAALNNSAQGQLYSQTANNEAAANAAKQGNFQNTNTTTGLNNAVQDSQFANQIAGNNQYINQLMSLLSGSQVQQPNFGSTPQTGVAGTDIAGIIQQNYANQNNAYNQGQAQWGGALGALGNIGSAALPFILSDERTKEGIKYDGGSTADGIPTADFRYIGDPTPRHGVIAQDVQRVRPDAIAKIGGILTVDARKIPEAA